MTESTSVSTIASDAGLTDLISSTISSTLEISTIDILNTIYSTLFETTTQLEETTTSCKSQGLRF